MVVEELITASIASSDCVKVDDAGVGKDIYFVLIWCIFLKFNNSKINM